MARFSPRDYARWGSKSVKIVAIRGHMAAVVTVIGGRAYLVKVKDLKERPASVLERHVRRRKKYSDEGLPFDTPVDSPGECNPNGVA